MYTSFVPSSLSRYTTSPSCMPGVFPSLVVPTRSRSSTLISVPLITAAGLRHLLCTDISRDGALGGPNICLYEEIVDRYPGLNLQASGGVASLDDLQALQGTGASAAITGKALLDGLFTVEEALEVLS